MTTPADGNPSNYRFADLTLDVARRSVTRGDQPIELKALDFDLLRFLVEQAPNVVNADVLAEKVWGRHFVSPENVAQRVMLLRQSLADDANKPRYIETVRNKGYRLIPVVERVPVQAPRAAPHGRGWLIPAATAVILLVSVGVTAFAAFWNGGSAEQPAPSPMSVAVLPFANRSPDPNDAYFAVGMQDEIVSQLTKISGLRVIPVRPGAREQPAISEIGRDLNVETVLDGSVYHAEGRLRVTPRLTDGRTGVSLWSNSYERERADIFAMQSEIAVDVARALSVELSAVERVRVARLPTTNPRARDLYITARAVDRNSETLLAVTMIDQALELDPGFKEAWVAKAHIRLDAAATDPGHADEHRRLGEQAAHRALELDPELGAAHKALGQALLSKNDWAAAEAAFGKARSLNAPEIGSYAFLQLAAGKFGPVAPDVFEESRAANPGNALYYRFLMFVYEGLGEKERASDLYEDAIRVFPTDSREIRMMQNQRMHWLISRNDVAKARAISMADSLNAEMLERLDAPEEALAELRRAFAANGPDNPNHYVDIGLWAGYYGDPALAFQAMRLAADAGSGRMAFVWMPQLEPMRRLPAFKAYMRENGMVAYWQKYGWPPFCRPLDPHDFECN